MAAYSSRTSQRLGTAPRARDFIMDGAAPRSPARPMPQRERPATIGDMDEDSIGRSVRAVERAVETFATLQQNHDHYRALAIELRQAVDDEKEHAKVFAQQLADAERSRRADRDRADRAERRLEQAAQAIHDLEHQLAAMRAQTDRLVHTVNRLNAGDRSRDARAIGADLADLLAA